MTSKIDIQEAFNLLGVSPFIDIDLEPDYLEYGESSVRIRIVLNFKALDNREYNIDKYYPMKLYDDLRGEEILKSLIYTYLKMLMGWDYEKTTEKEEL